MQSTASSVISKSLSSFKIGNIHDTLLDLQQGISYIKQKRLLHQSLQSNLQELSKGVLSQKLQQIIDQVGDEQYQYSYIKPLKPVYDSINQAEFVLQQRQYQHQLISHYIETQLYQQGFPQQFPLTLDANGAVDFPTSIHHILKNANSFQADPSICYYQKLREAIQQALLHTNEEQLDQIVAQNGIDTKLQLLDKIRLCYAKFSSLVSTFSDAFNMEATPDFILKTLYSINLIFYNEFGQLFLNYALNSLSQVPIQSFQNISKPNTKDEIASCWIKHNGAASMIFLKENFQKVTLGGIAVYRPFYNVLPLFQQIIGHCKSGNVYLLAEGIERLFGQLSAGAKLLTHQAGVDILRFLLLKYFPSEDARSLFAAGALLSQLHDCSMDGCSEAALLFAEALQPFGSAPLFCEQIV